MTHERCQHAFAGTPILRHSSWVLDHCLGPEDDTCWCEPEVLVQCRHCEAGLWSTEDKEEWQVECAYCHDSGMMEPDGTEEDDTMLYIIHNDR